MQHLRSLPVTDVPARRLCPRHSINVALDLITLRSGIPDSIPGRCIDISEAGIGGAVAGEIAQNQHVGIELKLPGVALPLRVRAIVRHHGKLRCGLQFVNLTLEQREMIRFWIHRNVTLPEPAKAEVSSQPAVSHQPQASPDTLPARRRWLRIRLQRRSLFALLVLTLALAAFAWWYWEHAWRELESLRSGQVGVQLCFCGFSSNNSERLAS